MNTTKRRAGVAVVAALLLLAGGLAWAGTPMSENYGEIKKPSTNAVPTFTAAFSGLDGTDSTTWTSTPIAGRVISTSGDPMLEVTVRHSAPGATACVVVGHRDKNGGFHGIADVQTSTSLAGNVAVYDGTGYYGLKLYFHLGGWAQCEVRAYDCSGSTTVDLKPVTQGVAGRAAE